jgi:spore germination cell wall hydrolase CwlJ-like protein
VVREPDAMDRAKKTAAQTLDGKLWLPEVGKATHYHAYWVRPGWVREMTKLHKLGVHTFYRPRAWGDGRDAPTWGDPETTAAIAKQL